MKKLIILLCIVLLVVCIISGCKKTKGGIEPQDDPELPPKTQTGANTFGCRVNDNVWIPKGTPFQMSAIAVSYDQYYNWGTLNISTRRITDSNYETITIFSDSIKTTGTYPLTKPRRQEGLFKNYRDTACQFDMGSTHERIGSMTITKFDLQNAIISGTFEFTLKKTDCTIAVTNGRFDLKL